MFFHRRHRCLLSRRSRLSLRPGVPPGPADHPVRRHVPAVPAAHCSGQAVGKRLHVLVFEHQVTGGTHGDGDPSRGAFLPECFESRSIPCPDALPSRQHCTSLLADFVVGQPARQQLTYMRIPVGGRPGKRPRVAKPRTRNSLIKCPDPLVGFHDLRARLPQRGLGRRQRYRATAVRNSLSTSISCNL